MKDYQNKCPKLANKVFVAFLDVPNLRQENGNCPIGRNSGHGRVHGRAAKIHGRGRGQEAHAHTTLGEPTVKIKRKIGILFS